MFQVELTAEKVGEHPPIVYFVARMPMGSEAWVDEEILQSFHAAYPKATECIPGVAQPTVAFYTHGPQGRELGAHAQLEPGANPRGVALAMLRCLRQVAGEDIVGVVGYTSDTPQKYRAEL